MYLDNKHAPWLSILFKSSFLTKKYIFQVQERLMSSKVKEILILGSWSWLWFSTEPGCMFLVRGCGIEQKLRQTYSHLCSFPYSILFSRFFQNPSADCIYPAKAKNFFWMKKYLLSDIWLVAVAERRRPFIEHWRFLVERVPELYT